MHTLFIILFCQMYTYIDKSFCFIFCSVSFCFSIDFARFMMIFFSRRLSGGEKLRAKESSLVTSTGNIYIYIYICIYSIHIHNTYRYMSAWRCAKVVKEDVGIYNSGRFCNTVTRPDHGISRYKSCCKLYRHEFQWNVPPGVAFLIHYYPTLLSLLFILLKKKKWKSKKSVILTYRIVDYHLF